MAAPLGAFLFSLIASAIVLIAAGSNPIEAARDMLEHASKLEVQVSMINRATPLYISGVAAAIGFKMNLFNIGVEGQYRMAAIFAAYVGGAVVLPSVLHIGLILITAMVVGGLWGGFAGVLYTHRGVNEVIGTIMLNGVALGVIAWLVPALAGRRQPSSRNGHRTHRRVGSVAQPQLHPRTLRRPPGQRRTHRRAGDRHHRRCCLLPPVESHSLSDTTCEPADSIRWRRARAACLPAKWPSQQCSCLVLWEDSSAWRRYSATARYDPNFVGFLGFNGIAVALLGRNNPAGIAVGALLWAFLDATSDILQVTQTAPKEIIDIMRGVILLTVVIGYEVVRRMRERAEATRTAARLAEATS